MQMCSNSFFMEPSSSRSHLLAIAQILFLLSALWPGELGRLAVLHRLCSFVRDGYFLFSHEGGGRGNPSVRAQGNALTRGIVTFVAETTAR
jgi:hypothetical protein